MVLHYITLTQPETYQLTANVSVNEDLSSTFIWETSNPEVATVSASGLITSVGKGAAKIELTFDERTSFESGYDYLRIYDGNGNENEFGV